VKKVAKRRGRSPRPKKKAGVVKGPVKRPLPVAQQVHIRVPALVAIRLQRTAEIAQLPQEQVVLSLLALALALTEAQHDDWEIV